MAEKKLTLKQALAAIWQEAGDTFATKTDLSKLSGFVYGVSSTAVGTAAKVITAQNVASGWELEDGTILAVSFSAGTNTASNPTFNVNSSGPQRVKYKGSLIASSNLDFAGTTLVQFYYYHDGGNNDRYWEWFFRDYGDEVVVAYYKQADKKLYTNSSFTGSAIIPDTEKIYLDPATGLAYVAKDQSTVKLLGADNVVRGYYKQADGKFYLTRSGSEESYTYSNEVDYNDNKLYIDKATGKVYTSSGTNMEMFFDTNNYYTKSQVDGLISGYVPTSRKVNGHPLTSDVTVSKSDVGLGKVTNDAQVKLSEMGAANGVAELDSNAKVKTSQLPIIPLANLPADAKNVIVGYYVYDTTANKGKFYLERTGTSSYTYSGEVPPSNAPETVIYRDQPSKQFYISDGSEFVILNGDYFAVTQTELNEILGIS